MRTSAGLTHLIAGGLVVAMIGMGGCADSPSSPPAPPSPPATGGPGSALPAPPSEEPAPEGVPGAPTRDEIARAETVPFCELAYGRVKFGRLVRVQGILGSLEGPQLMNADCDRFVFPEWDGRQIERLTPGGLDRIRHAIATGEEITLVGVAQNGPHDEFVQIGPYLERGVPGPFLVQGVDGVKPR
jgi:hypothetical protein